MSRVSRRGFLALGALCGLGALSVRRAACYADIDWDGRVLGNGEAQTVMAAAEAFLPDVPGPLTGGPLPYEVALNVDRYLEGMPSGMLWQVQGMLALIEQGTLISGKVSRFTELAPPQRLEMLEALSGRGGLAAQAVEGLRALCMLGWYQDRRTWGLLGYDGPQFERLAPEPVPDARAAGSYGEWVAAAGQRPKAAV